MYGGGTVSNCTETALNSALSGGGTVTFACNGTISLSGTIEISDDTVVDGTGHNVTISGANNVRLFIVPLSLNFFSF